MGLTARRTLAVLGTGLALSCASAGPVGAHGALSSPASRAAQCGPEGDTAARSAACRAARAASAPGIMAQWDNLRVPGVAGRDRAKIPDGRLCSGGLDSFRGLDLPRADWPATRLTPGSPFAFRYRVTIRHRGVFKLYVTRNGYDPARRLTWSALEAQPFLTVSNPPVNGGVYVLNGRLPAGRSGRHLIYTIWQTTDTPDTYYSCADVQFTARRPAAAAAKPSPPAKTGRKHRRAASPSVTASTPVFDPAAAQGPRDQDGPGLLPWGLAGTAALGPLVLAALAIRRHRRSRQ